MTNHRRIKLLFDTYLGHIREHNFENTLENLEQVGSRSLYQ